MKAENWRRGEGWVLVFGIKDFEYGQERNGICLTAVIEKFHRWSFPF
jgi:hypothetical protein